MIASRVDQSTPSWENVRDYLLDAYVVEPRDVEMALDRPWALRLLLRAIVEHWFADYAGDRIALVCGWRYTGGKEAA